MKKSEVIFVHEGKECDEGANKIYLMPMGLIALADFLEKNGIKARVLHNEIENGIDPKFNLTKKLKEIQQKIICIDLHWHQQITSVINLIKEIKIEIPESIIIVGGYTASFFHMDLMENVKEIDYIIRGDAEMPLLALVRCLLENNKGNIEKTPNLVYRSEERINTNPVEYCLTSKIMGQLNFANFSLLSHYKEYLNQNAFDRKPSNTKEIKPKEPLSFFYNCGRGCPYNCSICGGSKKSQEMISNRKGIIYAPIKSVIRNLKIANSYGIGSWYNTFDPSKDKTYFIELFSKIRKNSLLFDLKFECLHIPSKEFIKEIEKTFRKAVIYFVLKTGSDRLRQLNKGNYYSNKEILQCLKDLSSSKIKVRLSFLAGLPFENKEDIIETLSFISQIKNEFNGIKIVATTLEMEPGAPWHLDNEKYEIECFRKSFEDFCIQHKKKSGLGYRTKNFSSEEIQLIKSYYNAESTCIRGKSYFLESLFNSKNDSWNLSELHKICIKCSKHEECFKDLKNG